MIGARFITVDEAEIRADMRRRIRAGMAALDTEVPGWEEIINPKMLDLQEADCCIVGQIRRGTDWWLSLTAYVDDESGSMTYPPELGFDLTGEEQEHTLFSALRLYSILTEEWLSAIGERRAAR